MKELVFTSKTGSKEDLFFNCFELIEHGFSFEFYDKDKFVIFYDGNDSVSRAILFDLINNKLK